MILVDSNLLIFAVARSSANHERARVWLDEKLGGTAKVGLPWISLLAFLRLTTNPRAARQPLNMGAACAQVSEWLDCDVAWIPQPTERHAETLAKLLETPGVTANLVTDAHLAALAIEHGLTLCSADGDFARFKGLRWHNPLA